LLQGIEGLRQGEFKNMEPRVMAYVQAHNTRIASGIVSVFASGFVSGFASVFVSGFVSRIASRIVSGIASRFVSGFVSRFVSGFVSRFVSGIASRFVSGFVSRIASRIVSGIASRFVSRWPKLVLSGLFALLLSACSQQPISSLNISPGAINELLEGKALIRAGYTKGYVPPEESVLALSEEMRAFLKHYVPSEGTRQQKLDGLLYALMHKGTLGINYNPASTYTARDTFENQSGNCVGFSVLFVAMARELGLSVKFNKVEIPPVWGFQGKSTFLFYKHINSIVKLGAGVEKVVDINIQRYQHHYRQKKLSDNEAMAQYFNNRGVDYLLAIDYASAFNYFRKGLSLDPKAEYIWSSLGTLYRRAGFLADAETAYLYGLTFGSRNLVILNNLSHLYKAQGRYGVAEKYRLRVEAARKNNPYYRFALAQKAFANSNYDEAMREIEVALKKKKREHQFWYLAARISDRLEGSELAKEYLLRAMALAEDPDVLDRYRATQVQFMGRGAG